MIHLTFGNDNIITGAYGFKPQTPSFEIEESEWQKFCNHKFTDLQIVGTTLTVINDAEQRKLVIKQCAEYMKFLNKTDHKMIPGYEPDEGETIAEIETARKTARDYIRANKELLP